jgi:chromosome partitioning protein
MTKPQKLAVKKAAKVVTVNNQKGGVGKTTLVFHLAKAVAEAGKRALVIDTDTQANISQFLTGNLDIKKNREGGAGYIFGEGAIPHGAPMETEHPGVWLLHGHEGLDQWDNNPDSEERVMSSDLRLMLRSLDFDVILVDTPPAVGVRHLAPLIWADLVVIPMEPAQSAVAGFQEVLASIESAQTLNPALQWIGVLNRLHRSARSHREIEAFVKTEYGNKIAPTLSARTAVADAMQDTPARPVWRARNADKELRELWLGLCTKLAT